MAPKMVITVPKNQQGNPKVPKPPILHTTALLTLIGTDQKTRTKAFLGAFRTPEYSACAQSGAQAGCSYTHCWGT